MFNFISRILLTICTLMCCSASHSAWFQAWEIEAGLEIPVQISGRLKAQINNEFYLVGGAGLAMDFLLGMHTSVTGGAGILGESTAEVVEAALSNSIVIDLRGGWNLHKYNGLYLEAGYMFMTGGSGDIDVPTLESAFGQDYHNTVNSMSPNSLFSIASDVHSLTLHGGYRWQVFTGMILSADIGIIKPFMGTTTLTAESVSPNSASARNVAAALVDEVETEMSNVYLSQLFIPTVSLWLSYPF